MAVTPGAVLEGPVADGGPEARGRVPGEQAAGGRGTGDLAVGLGVAPVLDPQPAAGSGVLGVREVPDGEHVRDRRPHAGVDHDSAALGPGAGGLGHGQVGTRPRTDHDRTGEDGPAVSAVHAEPVAAGLDASHGVAQQHRDPGLAQPGQDLPPGLIAQPGGVRHLLLAHQDHVRALAEPKRRPPRSR